MLLRLLVRRLLHARRDDPASRTESRTDTGGRASVVGNLTGICDVSMALAIAAVMSSIMFALVKQRALLSLLSPLVLILLVHAFDVAAADGGGGGGGEGAEPASLS